MVAQLISLDSLKAPTSARDMRAAISTTGCTSGACGSSEGPDDMPAEIWEKVKDHPCYSEEAHHYFARMHVAVAPACNIQCHYCNRKYDCANESRPGVVSERLTPDEAVRKVIAVANEVPQLSVLGIAGPGDAVYDWAKTKATFEAVAKEIPDIKLCLSTNGLALPEHVDEIAEMAVDHVTITINTVDPEIGAQIYPWIFHQHRRWTGVEAATILLERQMRGLEMLVARGILVKVNSVMIPGINDEHLVEVNRVVKEKGAFLHNIMPLISDASHGTHFGLTGQRGPRPMEVKALQDRLGGGTKLMRHCRQCRADAVGILGEDRGQEFTLDQLPETVTYDPAAREEYRALVAHERGEHGASREAAEAELRSVEKAPARLVAVASRGGGRINQHFGHATEFLVFEVSSAGVTFVGPRKVEQYCQGGFGEADTLAAVIDALEGVSAVLVAKIGEGPTKKLAAAGISASDAQAYEWIEAGIAAWYAAEFAADQGGPAIANAG
ncbi:nitrogenase cofactor biosynthesis protein NifB [Afifella sp. IM 167]|uniref:nitrogenase cofactor biosynthesis protein NifB n=1 Tax=Afifella sp. IM 167 TaxID=2033586 RepID=UPI001CCFCD73|nr:nitrogenase cofactor biosynthesis protein NifB [Afifella sp. IM 167]MBZ8135254.1 nitrogenase cofactor biosynthesis protein NifB [Afifella sp. IM 167]